MAKAKKASHDWLSYIDKLKALDAKIAHHKENGHHHSAKKLVAKRKALKKEINDLKKAKGL
jgi:hypothetical protein